MARVNGIRGVGDGLICLDTHIGIYPTQVIVPRISHKIICLGETK